MSPILVRPVREQLEHDRIIRLLPGRYRRRFEVAINPGAEQNAGVGTGPATVFPDAVLYSTERARKIQGVVEVETVESVNHLEAMAQWAHYGRLKVPFHLYVPVVSLDVARRLSSDHQAVVAEIWTYDNIGDQVRFTLVHKLPEATKSGGSTAPKSPKVAARPVKAVRPPKAAKAARPASRPSRPAAAPRRKPAPRKPARAMAKPAAKRATPARAAKAPVRKGTGGQKRK